MPPPQQHGLPQNYGYGAPVQPQQVPQQAAHPAQVPQAAVGGQPQYPPYPAAAPSGSAPPPQNAGGYNAGGYNQAPVNNPPYGGGYGGG